MACLSVPLFSQLSSSSSCSRSPPSSAFSSSPSPISTDLLLCRLRSAYLPDRRSVFTAARYASLVVIDWYCVFSGAIDFKSSGVIRAQQQLQWVLNYTRVGRSSRLTSSAMEAKVFLLACAPPPLPIAVLKRTHITFISKFSTPKSPLRTVVLKNKSTQEQEFIDGLPKEYYDDEWQARQREKTKELHRRRQEEDEEESKKDEEYLEIGTRLQGYPEEEVRKARRLVSSFIRSAEEVEEKIEEAAEKGELTELVLMVIWNRLDLARRDEEKDVIRSLDLLYRRVETEILKREATPAMRLLNDLLNLHDGFDEEGWLKECRKHLVDTFPREDPFSILVPAGFDIDTHQGQMRLPSETDDVLLRVDFIREVDALLQEVRAEQDEEETAQGLDPESIATRLKQQEKQRAIRQVEALLDLAVTLKW